MAFNHLHVRSTFSLLEGLAAPAELARTARRLEIPALALTDHNRLTGAIEFYDACLEAGVQPILGLEADVLPPPELAAYSSPAASPLVLLASEPGRLGQPVPAEQPAAGRPGGGNPAHLPGAGRRLAQACSA